MKLSNSSFHIPTIKERMRDKIFRPLTDDEVKKLTAQNCTASDWNQIRVKSGFDTQKVTNSTFNGSVCIGAMDKEFLENNGLKLAIGIYNCTIADAWIGDNIAFNNVHYLANYVVEDSCVLFNISEMHCNDSATFGNGFLEENKHSGRNLVEVINENGGRAIAPFAGMLPADAYLSSHFRDDEKLHNQILKMVDRKDYLLIGNSGYVGTGSVIKNCSQISDSQFGSNCLISNNNCIKNSTISGNKKEPTEICNGNTLQNCIIGPNNSIENGVSAINSVTGRNVSLKLNARVIHSYIGPNSTVACAEILHNLLFPFHEQHHNNSFLIANFIAGQSNIAAGATIGSNHNSRAADGEIHAGRGFWPGLVTNFKHNCMFAPFTIIAKGNYNSELNIKVPFSLLSVNEKDGMLQLFPAYWFRYNMYALARNAWKFKQRDRRWLVEQHVETEFLAPDTVESIFEGLDILLNGLKELDSGFNESLLFSDPDLDRKINLMLNGIANKAPVKIIKPVQGIGLFRDMIQYYGTVQLVEYINHANELSDATKIINFLNTIKLNEKNTWHNVGGLIIDTSDLDQLLSKIKSGKVNSWSSLHHLYTEMWNSYQDKKQIHGIKSLLRISKMIEKSITTDWLNESLQKAAVLADQIYSWALESREKDFIGAYRKVTYRNDNEMRAILVTPENDPFLLELKKSTDVLTHKINGLLSRLKS